jgi:DNA-directed RNA polymerase II subunit RPB3
MNPSVKLISENNDELQFRMSGTNVSIANSIRRTVLSEIPILVFKTAPYEENLANIIVNTSRLTNEILKQRLSCIPIRIKEIDNFPLKNYRLELNVENNTDTTIIVTTKDFTIIDLTTNKPVSENKTREIFPPFASPNGEYYIDFVRLRTKIGDSIPGEKIHLTCDFSISNAKESGMFNVVSTCAYSNTQDEKKIDSELAKKIQKWKDDKLSAEEIKFETENWKLLDAMRIFIPDSFDFTIKSIGIYSNEELLIKSCDILIKKIETINNSIETDDFQISKALTTIENSYDIVLTNEDYTIGKALEYILYTKFYEEQKTMTYCGFSKKHPHDDDSIIRVAYSEAVDISSIKKDLGDALIILKQIYEKMKKEFLNLVKN